MRVCLYSFQFPYVYELRFHRNPEFYLLEACVLSCSISLFFMFLGSQICVSTAESIRMSHLDPPIQVQIPSTKIKLQLFPINEQTRLGLEKV